VSRGFLLSFIALGLALAALFAVYPSWDMRVAEWFFDPQSAEFPVAVSHEWNVVRRAAKSPASARPLPCCASSLFRASG
jgi:hypothetical protein